MHYVCIENNQLTAILGYEPSVPSSVSIVTITDDQHKQLMAQTHKFDVPSRTVVPVDSAILTQKETDVKNAAEREFLNSTDWKVLRHMRQKTLNIPTTMSESEYLALEQQRQAASVRIV